MLGAKSSVTDESTPETIVPAITPRCGSGISYNNPRVSHETCGENVCVETDARGLHVCLRLLTIARYRSRYHS